AAFRISRGLAAEGIGMLRYDALGVGGSGGELGDGSFTVKVADTVRAAEFLTERGTPPQLLVGHSCGGAAAIIAAQQIPSIRAVATTRAPAEPADVERHYDAIVDKVLAERSGTWNIGGREITLQRDVGAVARTADGIGPVPTHDRPLPILSPPPTAPRRLAPARTTSRPTLPPRWFAPAERPDHVPRADRQAQRAARMISEWAAQY